MFVSINSNTTGVVVKQDLLSLPEHLIKKKLGVWVNVAHSIVFYVVFCA